MSFLMILSAMSSTRYSEFEHNFLFWIRFIRDKWLAAMVQTWPCADSPWTESNSLLNLLSFNLFIWQRLISVRNWLFPVIEKNKQTQKWRHSNTKCIRFSWDNLSLVYPNPHYDTLKFLLQYEDKLFISVITTNTPLQ